MKSRYVGGFIAGLSFQSVTISYVEFMSTFSAFSEKKEEDMFHSMSQLALIVASWEASVDPSQFHYNLPLKHPKGLQFPLLSVPFSTMKNLFF